MSLLENSECGSMVDLHYNELGTHKQTSLSSETLLREQGKNQPHRRTLGMPDPSEACIPLVPQAC